MATRKGRKDNNEKRYEDIVHIAGELFAERGFTGTSLNDIASSVGVLKGSLYHYISSKEDLLFDVVKVAHEGLHENMRLADHFADDPIRQITALSYGHIVLNAVVERMHRGIVFLHDSKYLPVKRRNLVTKDRDSYALYLRDIVARGQKAGQFDAELDPRMCSFAVFGVITSYIRWYKPGGQITPHTIGRESAAFILASVESPETRAKMGSRFAVVDEVIAEFKRVRESERASEAE